MKRRTIGAVFVGLAAPMGFLSCGLEEVRFQETANPEVAAFKIESHHVISSIQILRAELHVPIKILFLD
jgi:hypothetical protein